MMVQLGPEVLLIEAANVDIEESCKLPVSTKHGRIFYNPYTKKPVVLPFGHGSQLFNPLKGETLQVASRTAKPFAVVIPGVEPSNGVETRPLLPQPLKYAGVADRQIDGPYAQYSRVAKLVAQGYVDADQIRKRQGMGGLPVASPTLRLVP